MTNRTLVVLILFALFLTGCSTTKMAFENDTDTITSVKHPVFLMSVTLKNTFMPLYQPKLLYVPVKRTDQKGSYKFKIDEKAKMEFDTPESGNSYLLRMELENGEYVIRTFSGYSGVFPISGRFNALLNVQTKSEGSGIFYLGHVSATVREGKGDERRAGPVIPLIDQAVTGFSGGTFDIEITDQFDKDESLFKSRFPALSDVTIKKAILPKFDKGKAENYGN